MKGHAHFAKAAQIRAGLWLTADDGFTCLPAWCRVEVRGNAQDGYYILCAEGKHFLDGQEDERGYLVGM